MRFLFTLKCAVYKIFLLNIITKMFGFTFFYIQSQHTTSPFTCCDLKDGELQVV